MKIVNFVEWWALNREKINWLVGLWLIPKKVRDAIKTVTLVLDLFAADDYGSGVSGSAIEAESRIPCIRLLPNGGTELINCKTGEAIKPKD